jgi:plastocyanin
MLRRSIAVLAAAFALAGAGALPVQSAVVVKATYNLSGDPVFKPRRVEIVPGTRVVWKSVSGNHTVTSYGGGWSKNTMIAQGTQTGFTFQSAGTFKYRCTFHSTLSAGVCSGQCGRVQVA